MIESKSSEKLLGQTSSCHPRSFYHAKPKIEVAEEVTQELHIGGFMITT
jgi:hypothetical protein